MSLRIFSYPAAALALALTVALTGCGHSSTSSSGPSVSLRLGYVTRITHASALVGIDKGLFVKNLGPTVNLEVTPFEQGTEEATALLSNQIDAAYVGPNPAFNVWQKSHGTAIKIISGSAAGGTSMVVRPGIASAQDLRGKTVASPALGGNPDVSLRSWLKQNGLQTTPRGGGDVFIKPTKPESAVVQEFVSNQIVGAIESAPYDVQLVKAGGIRLWEDPTTITVLVVRQEFLQAHPEAVSALLRGQVEANDLIHSTPEVATQAANATLGRALGKGLDTDVLTASFAEATFTNDPDAASLREQVQKAVSVGLLDPLSLDGIFDLRPLNDVLKSSGKPEVGA
jgi:NitT/TauT family transport system substrate-binding protein